MGVAPFRTPLLAPPAFRATTVTLDGSMLVTSCQSVGTSCPSRALIDPLAFTTHVELPAVRRGPL